MTKKIVVGMSGGVDSSITLILLKKSGWDPVGVSLMLPKWENAVNCHRENVCCTTEALEKAKKICDDLGVPYHQYGVQNDFKEKVMDYFVSELKENRTPNPCVICNRDFKFTKLFEFAKKHGIEHVSTGHYAKIIENKETGKYELRKPKDISKDQTYGLSFLPQNWLKHIILPLGDYLKQEVYDIAKEEGFEFFLKTKQSQDLCFVSGSALPKYIEEKIGNKVGEIVDETGKVLGKHKGLHYYTIGQKKGVGLPQRYFVKGFNTKKNYLVVTLDKESIARKEMMLFPYNFISGEDITESVKVTAKVRYGPIEESATLYPPKDGKLKIVFDELQNSVAPGQFCVFYQEDLCLGAGIIH